MSNLPENNIESNPIQGSAPKNNNKNTAPEYVYTRPEDYRGWQNNQTGKPQKPETPNRTKVKGGKGIWIIATVALVIVIAIIAICLVFKGESKPKEGVVITADGMTYTTEEGVSYKFPSDRARLGLNGEVKRVEEIYEYSPTEKFRMQYEFDDNGFLTSSTNEGIGYPNSWHENAEECDVTYHEGFIRESIAKKTDGTTEHLKYEYRPDGNGSIKVVRKLENGEEELAMELTFGEDRVMTTRIEQPYGDTFIIGSDGKETFSSTIIDKEKDVETDSQGNWTKKKYIDYIVTRKIEY